MRSQQSGVPGSRQLLNRVLVFSIADFLQFGNGCQLFANEFDAIAFQREHAGLNGILLYFMCCFVFLIDSRMLLLMVINS